MKQKFLMGCLAFAILVGFNFRHAFNDYGLAMSSFMMAYASDSSSDGTDETGTDGTTGTGTEIVRYMQKNGKIKFTCSGTTYKYSRLVLPDKRLEYIGYKMVKADGITYACKPANIDEILNNLSAANTSISYTTEIFSYVDSGSLVLTPPLIEVGEVRLREVVPISFSVKNLSEVPVQMTDISASCECLDVDTSSVWIAPGDSYAVHARLRMTDMGDFMRDISFRIGNDGDMQSVNIVGKVVTTINNKY